MKTTIQILWLSTMAILLCYTTKVIKAQGPPLPLEIAKCQDFFGNVEQGNLATIKHCLQLKPELLDKEDELGLTPLMIAVRAGQIKIVDYFIKIGADMDKVAPDGTNALHFALKNGNEEIIKLLLQSGARYGVNNEQRKSYKWNFEDD